MSSSSSSVNAFPVISRQAHTSPYLICPRSDDTLAGFGKHHVHHSSKRFFVGISFKAAKAVEVDLPARSSCPPAPDDMRSDAR